MLDYLAHVVSELGRMDEAEVLSRRVLQVRERTSGPRCAGDGHRAGDAGRSVGEEGRPGGSRAAAAPGARGAGAVLGRRQPGERPDDVAPGRNAPQLVTLRRGRTLARRTLEIWEGRFGPDHEWIAWALISLSKIRLAQGDPTEAAGLAGRAAQILTVVFGPEHAEVSSTLKLQASALMASNKP